MVDNLKTKILININILIFKNLDLIIFIYINYIENYYIIFNLTIASSKLFIKREIRFKKEIAILIYSYITIFIEDIKLLFDNYIFKFIDEYPVILFFVIINNLFHAVLARNNFKYLILLSRKLQLNSVIDIEIDGYYYLNFFEKIYKLVVKLSKYSY